LVVLTTMTLRLMEQWRGPLSRVLGDLPDYEMTMIMAAVVSINAEKFMRMELEPNWETLAHPLPYHLLTECNLSSIAAAIGLNRETVRRKVSKLVDTGLLIKEDGSVHLRRGLLQRPIARQMIDDQLSALLRAVNQLERFKVLR
jgi:hypothetical protein